MLRERLEQVRERIRAAAERAGRPPSSVTLVVVTKGVAPELIQEAVGLGVTDVGENRVQEARFKQQQFRVQGSGVGATAQSPQPPAQSTVSVRWHLVGHLQRNKAKEAVELFHVIHSVESLTLAEALERSLTTLAQGSGFRAQGSCSQLPAPSSERMMEVFIQVNISGEASKFGCAPSEAPALVKAVSQCSHLRLRGLMTIPPLTDDAEGARPHFRALRQLRDDVASSFHLPPSSFQLSMGMSHDFEVAIEEGADVVRIGTAIFKGVIE